MLLDANGCPTEGQIMGPLARGKGEAKDLVANFDAFKFPSSEMVQFRALVTPCMPRCQPVECVYQDFYGGDNTRVVSYGRKKRGVEGVEGVEGVMERWSRSKRSQESTLGEEVLITHAFRISDKFDKKKKAQIEKEMMALSEKKSRKEPLASRRPNFSNSGSLAYGDEANFDPDHLEVCLNVTGLIAGVAVFLIVQLLTVFLWTHFWQSRNRKKMRDSTSSLR